ncbi:hypothetical protein [Mangrovibacterium marinum]|uniref:Putative transposase n=1 Tax=Mangrovibacterium marinum TaxID=1639118 RepID=A0A2T5C155_9BACT|nr:hypothetical protein [Mangrovibacterium marinum]PTN08363.1 putative transposase [Mangrovibacterium marinum]
MNFERNHIYHIYNRGNNSQPIFFSRGNYLFFLKKIHDYLQPYTDVLAWCLMPTHFHLMVYVNTSEMTQASMDRMARSENFPTTRTLNQSIGIMLRSYTRAIQIQEGMTGSLFQKQTKAMCISQINEFSRNWYNTATGTQFNLTFPEKEYPQICFNYIHGNPTKDGLVEQETFWEISSARDYAELRDGKLINKKRATELGLIYGGLH